MKKANKQTQINQPVIRPPYSWERLSVQLALLWGLVVVSGSLMDWYVISNAVRDLWTTWIASPDFSWKAFWQAMAGHIKGVLIPVSMLVGAFGIGRPVARLLKINDLFLRLALGVGVVSILVQGFGYPGLYFHNILLVTASLLVAWGVFCIAVEKPWREFAGEQWKSSLPKLAILGAVMIGAYLMGRVPDVGEDARMYHLAGPENYLFLHKIVAEPNQSSWHMPFGAEMTFLLPLILGGVGWAKQVNVAALFILLGLTWRLSGALGRRSLWAPIWAGTAIIFMGQCWETGNDLMLTMYLTGGVLCAVRGRVLASAIIMGLAIGVKFTAGLVVAGTLCGLYFAGMLVLSRARVVALCVAGLIPFLAWNAESWLYLGNPFHPFISGIIPDISWSPFYQEWLLKFARTISPSEALLKRDWLFGVCRVFGGYDIGSVALLWFFPAVLLGLKQKQYRIPIIVILVAYLIWVPSVRIARYLVPLIPLVSAMASDGASFSVMFSGWNNPRWRRFLAGYSLLLALGMSLATLKPSGCLFLAGQSSQKDVLEERYVTWEELREWVNENTTLHSRVLFTGEQRRLWFNRRIVSASPVGEPILWKIASESGTAEEIRKKLHQQGIEYLVDNFIVGLYRATTWFPGPEWKIRQLGVYHDFVSRYLEIRHIPKRICSVNGAFYAYRVKRPKEGGMPGRFVHHMPSTERQYGLTYVMLDQNRLDSAVGETENAINSMGETYCGSEVLAHVYSTQGRYKEALTVLKPGIKAGFIGNSNWGDYCVVTMRSGDPIEGAKAVGHYILMSANPNPLLFDLMADNLVVLGNAALTGERFPLPLKAGKYVKPLTPIPKGIPEKSLRKALEYYEQATWIVPEEPYFHIGVMQVLERLGRRKEAMVSASRAVRLAKGDPQILWLAGKR